MSEKQTAEYHFNGLRIILRLDEDNDWLAFFEKMPNISAFGDTKEEAIEELKIAYKATKESYRKHKEE